jgi:hypothetical protein
MGRIPHVASFSMASADFLAPREKVCYGVAAGLPRIVIRMPAPKNSRNRYCAWPGRGDQPRLDMLNVAGGDPALA